MLAAALSALDVIYAEDFEDPAPQDAVARTAPEMPEPEASELEVIEPTFTLAEVEAVRAAAHAEGAAAERARILAEGEATRLRSLDSLAEAFQGASEAARVAAEEVAEGLAQAVLSIVAAGLPTLCADHGEREARALIQSLLPTLGAEPRITVRLNPHLLDATRDVLAGLDPEIAAAIQLVPTDAMLPGDVRVSWEGGSCQRSAAAACAAVRDALAPLGLLLPPAHQPETPPEPVRIKEIAHGR